MAAGLGQPQLVTGQVMDLHANGHSCPDCSDRRKEHTKISKPMAATILVDPHTMGTIRQQAGELDDGPYRPPQANCDRHRQVMLAWP